MTSRELWRLKSQESRLFEHILQASALLVFCEGNHPETGGFPLQGTEIWEALWCHDIDLYRYCVRDPYRVILCPQLSGLSNPCTRPSERSTPYKTVFILAIKYFGYVFPKPMIYFSEWTTRSREICRQFKHWYHWKILNTWSFTWEKFDLVPRYTICNCYRWVLLL